MESLLVILCVTIFAVGLTEILFAGGALLRMLLERARQWMK